MILYPMSGELNGNMVNHNAVNAMGGTWWKYVEGADYSEAADAAAFNSSIEVPTTIIFGDCPSFIPAEQNITYLTHENYNEVPNDS